MVHTVANSSYPENCENVNIHKPILDTWQWNYLLSKTKNFLSPSTCTKKLQVVPIYTGHMYFNVNNKYIIYVATYLQIWKCTI